MSELKGRRAIVYRFGAPEVLTVEGGYSPKLPTSGEVLVRILAVGICHHDLLTRVGAFPGIALPLVPGHQAVGVVEQVGSAVNDVAPGDLVLTLLYAGCGTCDACEKGLDMLCQQRARFLGEDFDGVYQDWVTIPRPLIVPCPKTLSLTRAAVLVCTVGTAYHALFTRAHLTHGETVVVTGATGGVGTQVILLAKRAEAKIVAVTSREDKRSYLTVLGADDVIIAPNYKFARRVKELTKGSGADLVVEIVGAKTLAESLHALKYGGRIVVVGNIEGLTTVLNPALFILKEISLIGTKSVTRSEMIDLISRVAAGEVSVPNPLVLPFEQVAEAHRLLEAGEVRGRIVLTLA